MKKWNVKVRKNSHYFELFWVLFYLRKSVQGLLYLFVLVERFPKRTCRPLSDFNSKIYLLLKSVFVIKAKTNIIHKNQKGKKLNDTSSHAASCETLKMRLTGWPFKANKERLLIFLFLFFVVFVLKSEYFYFYFFYFLPTHFD